MSRFVVTIVANGNCFRLVETAADEADAVSKAKSRIPFSFDCLVCGVKWLGVCK